MVDESPPIRMNFLSNTAEMIRVLGETGITPDWIEVCLCQRSLDRIDLLDGVWCGTGHFVRRDSYQRTVLFVKCSLSVLHVAAEELQDYP